MKRAAFKTILTIALSLIVISCTEQQIPVSVNSNTGRPADKSDHTIFPKGERAPAQNFTGTVWVHMIAPPSNERSFAIGSVTFEPGARSNWHTHPEGQILLITQGEGRYQEKGKAMRTLKQGETVICEPKIAHWHGASPTSQMSHIAISQRTNNETVEWSAPVTDAEYGGGTN